MEHPGVFTVPLLYNIRESDDILMEYPGFEVTNIDKDLWIQVHFKWTINKLGMA